jgi:maltose/maltodextrin transport system substrate-binding protein
VLLSLHVFGIFGGKCILLAWTNGELLIWMDTDRGHGLEPIAKKFEGDFGVKVKIEAPENITDSFSIAAQAGKGPDILVLATRQARRMGGRRFDRAG